MEKRVDIIGAGLAGSEAALQLAQRGVAVRLFEMRPLKQTPVHQSGKCAELVCSNSLKSTKPESAAGMLKAELHALKSELLEAARESRVAAGGALAVDRDVFADGVTAKIQAHPLIELISEEVEHLSTTADALIVASGPLTSDTLTRALREITGGAHLAFYDAAAPIVMADSLDMNRLFRQSRYEEEGQGDYLNAPFDKRDYDAFIEALRGAERVVKKDFETRELFQACQPIEEIARKGHDAPRYGALKPVGLINPQTGKRPWAAVQLRAENAHASCYNLVGFQTNLTFPEQKRVFRMIPGFEKAEFARFGLMHRNTFVDAPRLLGSNLRLKESAQSSAKFPSTPIFIAGQLSGTEGYCEAMMSGLIAALSVYALLSNKELPALPQETAFGALLVYASDPATKDYQPMHVNFGLLPPLETTIKNKQERYRAFAARGEAAMQDFSAQLKKSELLVDNLDSLDNLEGREFSL
ncbi:MAG: methylenetetrahydrofolate--tRNA-(uracil(54)-C(5))-methyltransferase (FADH(2)-oxidizing) TrmFO [Eggerthellaceae bacterium]|nr:methylenetetrahydrofolate--tRNA-(uracil(54)-C(5))-methyltransferase (FADH(2)-oxidizing) TrmFO [Eggerthellaceae bacterium]